MTVSSHTFVHADEHPDVSVQHGFMRTVVRIKGDGGQVMIRGSQSEVEQFLVRMLAEFHRPLVAAMTPEQFGCDALPCPCGGTGPCCNREL